MKVGAEGSSSASLAFHSPVVGGDGVTVALAVSGESIWALQEASGRDETLGETLGVAGERVLKGWPLESLNRAHPCETLGDAAAELGAWAGRAASDAAAAGAAARALRGGAVPDSIHAPAADVSTNSPPNSRFAASPRPRCSPPRSPPWIAAVSRRGRLRGACRRGGTLRRGRRPTPPPPARRGVVARAGVRGQVATNERRRWESRPSRTRFGRSGRGAPRGRRA